MSLAGHAPSSELLRGRPVADQRRRTEHQLRTELTTISIAGQLLLRDSLGGDRQHRLATEILKATSRLEQCLNELLEADK